MTPQTPLTQNEFVEAYLRADADTKGRIASLLESPILPKTKLSDEIIRIMFYHSMEQGLCEEYVKMKDEAAVKLASAFCGKQMTITAPITMIAKAFLMGIDEALLICEES